MGYKGNMTKAKAPTLRQFQERFPTEEICLDHLMRTRYGIEHECELCGRQAKFHRVSKRRSYACNWCGHQVFPTAGTPFERTRTPLRDWFFVMFLFCTTRNGVAAKEVERQLGVTYKTAWRMCHEIREYMGQVDGNDPIGGVGRTVEIDEAIIGGKVSGKGPGRHLANKTVVLGMAQRRGNIITAVIPNVKRSTLWPEIHGNVRHGITIHTDELKSYRGLHRSGRYWHATVNHSAGEYVSPNGMVSVNALESFWAQLKRGIAGTHIHVSQRHLPKYLAEFEYRWNMRQEPHLMLSRLMTSFVR